jgi:hypothetical protein
LESRQRPRLRPQRSLGNQPGLGRPRPRLGQRRQRRGRGRPRLSRSPLKRPASS